LPDAAVRRDVTIVAVRLHGGQGVAATAAPGVVAAPRIINAGIVTALSLVRHHASGGLGSRVVVLVGLLRHHARGSFRGLGLLRHHAGGSFRGLGLLRHHGPGSRRFAVVIVVIRPRSTSYCAVGTIQRLRHYVRFGYGHGFLGVAFVHGDRLGDLLSLNASNGNGLLRVIVVTVLVVHIVVGRRALIRRHRLLVVG